MLDLYEIDQTVAGARIESIEKDAVVLVCDGQRKVLRLNIGQSGSYQNTWSHKPDGSGERTFVEDLDCQNCGNRYQRGLHKQAYIQLL
ncbi:unnamed protein product [marine sediment metagenome]|uniref:Uncharacterized protein n=1 Tax=marine sediment metagenome TaxID=412755 RepID=X1E6E5_9ZZZZ